MEPVFRWRIAGDNAVEFLKKVSPYLIIKRKQALLGIQFQESKVKRNLKWRDELQIENEDKIAKEFRVLNHRGPIEALYV